MKVIFNCYCCGKSTEHELTDVEFQCACGRSKASTTLSPNNADLVLVRELSKYDVQVKLEDILDCYFDLVDSDQLGAELSLVLSALWVGFTSGKIKGPVTWGPPVCATLEYALSVLKIQSPYIMDETLYKLTGVSFEASKAAIQVAIDILKK